MQVVLEYKGYFVCFEGSGGRHHTAVITDNGKSYTFGSNLHVSLIVQNQIGSEKAVSLMFCA